ncbi:hypothetical protein GCM10027168_31860 [Streptomyces capparidis]
MVAERQAGVRRRTRLLRTMLRIRAFEDAALDLARRGLVPGAVHPSTGHEAVAAGALERLGPADSVVSYYRCHGHALAVGVPPQPMFAELLGRASGVNRGKGGSMHLALRSRAFLGGNSIVGAGVPAAAGLAAAARIRGHDGVAIVFLGDGAMGAGVVLETLRIASRQALPLLLVCENNGWQDRTASPRVTDLAPARVSQGLGVPARTVDGNDPAEVADAAGALLGETRSGAGPRFLEAVTYLRDFHCQFGPVPPDEYRPADEVERWRERDPVARAERELAALGVPEEDLARERARAEREMADAAEAALAEPFPSAEEAAQDLTVAPWGQR